MEEQPTLAERILESVADALICADRSGKIIRWNRAATALFGFSLEEALGQSVDLIIPEHLRSPHWSGFDAAMAGGATKLQGRATLTRALHKSGRRLYVEMSFALVKGEGDDADAIGAVAIARDVTERVERERAAKKSS
jgi:PAS domain S-box-containing protein